MNRQLNVLLAFGFFLGFVAPALGQTEFRQGYLIKTSGDTLKGGIAWRRAGNWNNKCLIRETPKSAPVTYGPDEATEYGYNDGRYYRALELPKDSLPAGKVFVKVLATGPLSLYEYRNYFFVIKDGVNTVLPVPSELEPNAKITVQKDRRFAGLLTYLLQDCHINTSKTGYYESDLTDIANAYNKCKGAVPEDRKASVKNPFVVINIDAFTGSLASLISTQDHTTLFKPDYKTSFSVPVGAGVNVAFPDLFGKFSFNAEIWYVKSVYQAYLKNFYNSDILYQDITINATYLKIPLGLRFSYRKTGSTPYVKAGYELYFMKNVSTVTYFDRVSSDHVVIAEKFINGYGTVTNAAGVWFSVGYEKLLGKRSKAFAELWMENGNGFLSQQGASLQPGVVQGAMLNYALKVGLRY